MIVKDIPPYPTLRFDSKESVMHAFSYAKKEKHHQPTRAFIFIFRFIFRFIFMFNLRAVTLFLFTDYGT